MTKALLAELELDDLLRIARERHASDLHLTQMHPPRLRIAGELVILERPVLSTERIEHFIDMLFDERAREEFLREGDCDAAYTHFEYGNLRLHLYRTSDGIALAIRLLARDIPTFEQLRLPPILCDLIGKRSGLLLISGPTGSGKTTSLAACVDRLNTHVACHIIMVEDPIEYRHSSKRAIVSQRELHRDSSTYTRAIRSSLRSNVDVLCIGELRDEATMEAVLYAAETGHLVIATLHASDATQTIERFIEALCMRRADVRLQLAQNLLGVVSQQLVARQNGKGRKLAVEILVNIDATRALIREGKTHQLRNAIMTGRAYGMQTLEMHLSELVNRGEIGLDDARRVSQRPNEIHVVQSAVA